MYKVFDSSYHIIFSPKVLNNNYKIISNSSEIDSPINDSTSSFLVVDKNPFEALLKWFKDYKIIDAAGGLVKMQDSYLWIFRNNKWDLPKGKVEINENLQQAALREVQEECGIENSLKIVKLLHISFHVYENFGEKILKRTYWYLMSYNGLNNIKPQYEEGITRVLWADFKESQKYSKLSFENIQDVWNKMKI